jgi:hypothetical protein
LNEHGFIKAVHRHLSPEVYRWKIHDTYTGGVPDAFYCGPAGSLWVEYKYIKLPKRKTTVVNFGLSELQQIWLTQVAYFGQTTILAVGWEQSAQVFYGPHIHKSATQDELVDNSLSFKELASLVTQHCLSGG